MGCPGGSDRKESACNATDLSQEDPPEKGKAAHSGILAWRIPWTKESSGLQSLESQRVEHNLETNINFKCIKYIQILRNHHPSPEHFSSCKTETFYPLINNSPFSHLTSQQPPFHLVSMNFPTPGTLSKWHHTFFCLFVSGLFL